MRFIPFQPVSCTIHVTDRCNARCITCDSWKRDSKDELNTKELGSILIQLTKLGVRLLNLSGGEPLLRADLPYIVGKAHELGFKRIHLVTNALSLTEPMATELVNRGLHTVIISINGLKESHDWSRGVEGAFDKAMQSLEIFIYLRKSRKKDLDIRVSTIVMSRSLGEILDLVSLCSALNVKLSVQPIDNAPFFMRWSHPSLDAIDVEKLDSLIATLHKFVSQGHKVIYQNHVALEFIRNFFRDRVMNHTPCYLGYLLLYIGAQGDVYSGCPVFDLIGNLRERSLIEIVKSGKYRESLHKMFMKQCPGCVCGYALNLRVHLPALFEEMLWWLGLKKQKVLNDG